MHANNTKALKAADFKYRKRKTVYAMQAVKAIE